MPLGPAHISVTSSTAFFFMPTKVSKFLLLCVDTRHLYFVFFFFLYLSFGTLEKEMATHSTILAWKIPWMGEPCGLQFMGSQRVGHD